MGYNIYDEIAELIEAKGEVSYDEAKEFCYNLNVYIQECLDGVEKE